MEGAVGCLTRHRYHAGPTALVDLDAAHLDAPARARRPERLLGSMDRVTLLELVQGALAGR